MSQTDRSPPYLAQMVTLLTQILAASGGGGGEYSDFSGTIATGGVSQEAIPANASRVSFVIQNPTSNTESIFINFGAAATVENDSLEITPGSQFFGGGTAQVTIISATTGTKYIAKEVE